jgi:hypothetical protein
MPNATAPQSAYNPTTGETLNLIGGQWIAAPKGGTKPPEPQHATLNADRSLAISGWSGPKTAYNAKTKQLLELNPATNQWQPAGKYTKVIADMAQHPGSYLNPAAAIAGLAETTVQAFTGFAKQMNSMVAGAAAAAKTGAPAGTYHKAKEAYTKAWDALYGQAEEPETHWGWAVNQAFSFIGRGLNAEQQFIQKQTGSEAAGDVASLFTGVLLMDANEAGSHIKGVWNKVVGGKKPVQEGFDKFAAADPASAEKVADKMTDPEMKKALKERLAGLKEQEDRVQSIMNPKNYKVKQAAKAAKAKPTDSIVISQDHLDKMFDPAELERAQQAHDVTTTHELKARFDQAKKGFEEQAAWQQHEMTKEKLAQTVAKSAIPEGPWTDLSNGKELPPGDPTAMSHAFEAALFGKGFHSERGSLDKDLVKKVLEVALGVGLGAQDNPKLLKGAWKLLKRIPGYQIGEEKTRILTKEALSTFYPEGLSDKAEQAAAVLAKGMAVESHLKSIVLTNDKIQDAYWEGKPEGYQKQWLMDWEAGKTPKSPAEAKMLAQYKERMKMAYESDVANGVKEYTPIDNYVYHLFENGPAVDDFLTKKYGVAWGDPRFTKAREFRYIKEALDAGFRMKTTSPVNVVQAREFASLVAGIRVHLLEDLTKGGLAMRKVGDVKMPHGMIPRRSPSGQMYYLYPEVAQVVHNAFDSRSLWADPGIRGMSFRSWMYMKNRTVPVILSLSAFHPLHIGLGMDFASEMTRISQELASGVTSAKDTIPRLVKALTLVPGQAERSYKGFRMLRVMSGEEKNPTPEETQSLNYMLRGGFIPFNTSEFTTSAMKQLRGAIKRNAYVTAGWKLPWAMLEAIGYPIYQKWIPAIKTANYLEDVASAIKSDPDLLHDEARMNVRLNKIRKSAEDRFGQMSYNTLFWNRWARDIGQATTLSLGWKLGFMRQFAGQPFETAHALGKLAGGESLKGLISKGELNKTMFVGYYTMMAMGLGGMVTYLMTGSPPQTFQDYLLPRVGGNNPDGSPRRVNTMFYTREYASFYTHVKNEGLGQGLSEYAVNSAAPNFKMAHEFFTGLDYRNHEIYDPSAPEWKQLVQKTSNILGDLDPISVESYQRTGDKKGAILGALGFSPAPKYMTESPIEGKIKRMAGYYNQHITPFEKAQYSDEVVKLHAAAQKGDEAGYQQALETLSSKYHLTGEDLSRIQKTSHTDPMVNMFKHLTSQQQLRLIKTMTPEEKQKYVRAAHNETKKQLLQESGE